MNGHLKTVTFDCFKDFPTQGSDTFHRACEKKTMCIFEVETVHKYAKILKKIRLIRVQFFFLLKPKSKLQAHKIFVQRYLNIKVTSVIL